MSAGPGAPAQLGCLRFGSWLWPRGVTDPGPCHLPVDEVVACACRGHWLVRGSAESFPATRGTL